MHQLKYEIYSISKFPQFMSKFLNNNLLQRLADLVNIPLENIYKFISYSN